MQPVYFYLVVCPKGLGDDNGMNTDNSTTIAATLTATSTFRNAHPNSTTLEGISHDIFPHLQTARQIYIYCLFFLNCSEYDKSGNPHQGPIFSQISWLTFFLKFNNRWMSDCGNRKIPGVGFAGSLNFHWLCAWSDITFRLLLSPYSS